MSEVNKPRQFSLMKKGHLFANGKVFKEIYTTELYLDAKDQFIPGEFIDTKKIEVIELAPVLKMMDEMAKGYQQLINIVSCAGEITPDRERYMNMQIITRAPEIAKDKLTVYKTFKKEYGLDI